ncbi:PadR family transcriptional regulator [Hazenella sp. IB182357]|uniref:PadR family transcriptional regulator n=1 Tax=Polycladospora coralii TaxID=2771432 RepID=A0A926NA81_9BACL|nr:PadR family transcriptional regulator [Polycladospora coralii]MBD1372757.1 PadR family transcriptional regulator [Polycladospora coralii]MBS7531149.1 PadR family transcriptional regulator [Polycladospora coralii]
MSRENKTMYTLLGLLMYAPLTGYQIKRTIESSIKHFWQESYGQIYPTLKKLVELEFAVFHIEKVEGKPDRKVYAITEQGKAEFINWLERPIEKIPIHKNELLLKIFYGQHLDVKHNITQIVQYQQKMKDILDSLNVTEHFLMTKRKDDPHFDYWMMTLSHGQYIVEATIQWCEESIEKLERKQA